MISIVWARKHFNISLLINQHTLKLYSVFSSVLLRLPRRTSSFATRWGFGKIKKLVFLIIKSDTCHGWQKDGLHYHPQISDANRKDCDLCFAFYGLRWKISKICFWRFEKLQLCNCVHAIMDVAVTYVACSNGWTTSTSISQKWTCMCFHTTRPAGF